TYEEGVLAIANGVSSMTHVYNGMTGFLHRAPGLVGTALRVRDIYGEVIGDGHHSHVAALNVFFQSKGCDRGILITDSLRAKHCPPGGNYQLGGHDIEISKEGLAYLKGTQTIAGSTLSMNMGLKILVEKAGIPMDAAINACTRNPARCLGVDKRKGCLCAGYDADIVVLTNDYEVVQTYCCGKAFL
ncbi:MAG: amidohydrolase family protein, partial [Acetivibrio ethanolgignens]